MKKKKVVRPGVFDLPKAKPKPDNTVKAVVSFLVVAIVVIGFIVFVSSVLVKVPAGHVGVKFDKMAGGVQLEEFNGGQEGWGLKVPIMQSVTKMDVRSQTKEYRGEQAVTPKDVNGVNFQWDMVIRYKLDPAQAAEVYKTKGSDYALSIIGTSLRSRAREVLGEYAQEEVQTERMRVAEEIRIAVQRRVDQEAENIDILKPGFLIIESIDLRDLNYNPQIEQSIITKQKQLQTAQQKVYELQQVVKEKEIVETKAEAQRNKLVLEAEGRAQAVLLEGEARAKAIELVNDAYQSMPESYVNVKYAEALKEIATSGQNSVFMDISRFSQGGNNIGLLQYDKLIPAVKSTQDTE